MIKALSLNEMAYDCHALALSKGWYETDPKLPELIALMHSELSEALEVYRNEDGGLAIDIWFVGGPEGTGKPEGVPVELADCIILILSTAAYYGMDLDAAYARKTEYNKTRPYRHGGKRV